MYFNFNEYPKQMLKMVDKKGITIFTLKNVSCYHIWAHNWEHLRKSGIPVMLRLDMFPGTNVDEHTDIKYLFLDNNGQAYP